MNWKRIVGASAGVIGAAVVVFLAVRACDDKGLRQEVFATQDAVRSARAQMDSLVKQNQAYRDSIAMWRDSTAKVNDKLVECENGKKPAKKTKTGSKVVTKVVRDTVFVEKPGMPFIPGGNNTKITANDNQKNIVVQNEEGGKGSMTEINAENNQGNIVVNNGDGNVNIEKDPQMEIKVAYLEFKLDSLGREVVEVRDEKGNQIDTVLNAMVDGKIRKITEKRVIRWKTR